MNKTQISKKRFRIKIGRIIQNVRSLKVKNNYLCTLKGLLHWISRIGTGAFGMIKILSINTKYRAG